MNDPEGVMIALLLIGGALLLDCHLWAGGLVAMALGVLMFTARARRNRGAL